MSASSEACHLFDDCDAPLCPLQPQTRSNGIWYPDEPICQAKKFQSLPWVSKQKRVAKVKAPSDKYFTVDMLAAITQVHSGIEGIDPDQPLEQAIKAEQNWISHFSKRRFS